MVIGLPAPPFKRWSRPGMWGVLKAEIQPVIIAAGAPDCQNVKFSRQIWDYRRADRDKLDEK